MKHILLSTMVLGSALMSGAVTPDKITDGERSYLGNNFTVMPADLGYNGHRTIFGYTDYTTNKDSYSIEIWNSNLDLEKILTVDKVPFSGTNTIKGPELEYLWDYKVVWESKNISVDYANQLVDLKFPDGYQSISNGLRYTFYFRGNEEIPAQLAYDIQHSDYPVSQVKDYLAKNDIYDNFAYYDRAWATMSFYEKDGKYSNGEFVEGTSKVYSVESYDASLYCKPILYKNYDINQSVALPATQTLFDNDGDYEVLLPKLSGRTTTLETDKYIEVEYTNQYGENLTSGIYYAKVDSIAPILGGLEVKKINAGTGGAIFEFPDDLNVTRVHNIILMVIDSKKYLVVEAASYYRDWSYNTHYLYYNIDNSTGVKLPEQIRTVSVSPTFVNKGETIRVKLDNDGEISDITVVGINGAIEQQFNGNGEREKVINSSNLPQGVHVVGVRTADGTSYSRKVVVK